MDHAHKLAFVAKMTKMALEHVPHFDGGGVITAGNSNTPLGGIAGALTVQNGYQAQAPTSASTVGQQQATLANELQTEAAGGGPNPAQQQLIQNEQQIGQQQATNYANNRSLNPGLAARMAGNTAASTGQAAAGQAGIQQAQQQLAAQGQMANLTGQEQTGSLAAQGINAQVAQNNANAVQNTNEGILGGVGSALGLDKGGEVKANKGGKLDANARKHIAPHNFALPGGRYPIHDINHARNALARVAQHGTPEEQSKVRAAVHKKYPTLAGHKMAQGGMVPSSRAADPNNHMPTLAQGGYINTSGLGVPEFSNANDLQQSGSGSGSGLDWSSVLGGQLSPAAATATPASPVAGGPVQALAPGAMAAAPAGSPLALAAMAKGGKVPPQSWIGKHIATHAKGGNTRKPVRAMVSPGEIYLTPEQTKAVAAGKADPFHLGERIPGKAKVKGDSEKNDVVPKTLADGGMVLPRHITTMKDPERARAFVRNHLSKKAMMK